MNIWQRFKCWLIKKMGGYTEEELVKEVDEGTKVCNDDANEATELAMYWHQRFLNELDKYNAEHENYLVMLSLYNTTVEQKQTNSMQNVAIAADTIKDYCANRADCEGCPLHGECGCKTADKACPEYWD